MSIPSNSPARMNPKNWSTKVRVIVAGALALVLAGAGTIAAFALQPGAPQPTAAPTISATPTPTAPATPESAPLPRAAVVDGALTGWEAAPETVIGDVRPQVGAAADGVVAAFVDAPAIEEPVVALKTVATVVPGQQYEFSAQVRALSEAPTAWPVRLTVGGVDVPLPELNAAWVPVTTSFTADLAAVEIVVTVDGPVEGFGLDAVSIAPAGGENVVPNPSFEEVEASGTIVSDSLILRQDSAALGVNLAAGEASWSAKRYEDGAEIRGTAELRQGVSALPLDGVPQGYYSVTVRDSAGQEVSAPVAIIDYAGSRIPKDERLGAATHLERPANVDGAEAVASLGLSAARNDIKWAQNETTAGSYQWTQTYLDEMAKLKAQGIGLLGVIDSGNPVYTGYAGQAGWQKLKTPPEGQAAVDAFGRFAGAVAAQWDVIGIEVWNEFNHEPFNKGCRTPECYLPMLQSVEQHVQAVNPDIPIIAGSTANYDETWLNHLWDIGGLNHSDAVSFHPYDIYWDPDGAARVVGAATKASADRGAAMPVWLTELGWTTDSNMAEVSVDVQANSLIRAETMFLGAGGAKYFWYDLISDPEQVNKQGDPHEANFGLFAPRRDGLTALPPKPAAFAQALLASKIAGHGSPTIDQREGVRSVRFGEQDDFVRVAWASEGTRRVEYAADSTVTVTDAWGKVSELEPSGGKVSLDLTTTPAILEGGFTE